jgi:diacylglycerol kinase family enzyme
MRSTTTACSRPKSGRKRSDARIRAEAIEASSGTGTIFDGLTFIHRNSGGRNLKIGVVLNRDSGTLKDGDAEKMAQTIAEITRAHRHKPDVKLVHGPEITEALIAARENNDAVLAGGGDGTVSTAATHFAGHKTALGVLPLGTMNLFARALGIPLKLEEAVKSLVAGEKRPIDVGEVNGEIFVHHVTLGLHPRIVAGREREHYRSRLGKKLAGIKVWWKLLHRAPRMRLGLTVDSDRVKLKTASLIIANNRFAERLGGLPHSEMPDQGKLAVYAAQSRDWKELLAMSAEASFGKWESNSKLDFLEGREIAIHAQRAKLRASIDGELVYLRTPLRAKIRPSSLWVLCPASAEAEPKKASAAPPKKRRSRHVGR